MTKYWWNCRATSQWKVLKRGEEASLLHRKKEEEVLELQAEPSVSSCFPASAVTTTEITYEYGFSECGFLLWIMGNRKLSNDLMILYFWSEKIKFIQDLRKAHFNAIKACLRIVAALGQLSSGRVHWHPNKPTENGKMLLFPYKINHSRTQITRKGAW